MKTSEENTFGPRVIRSAIRLGKRLLSRLVFLRLNVPRDGMDGGVGLEMCTSEM